MSKLSEDLIKKIDEIPASVAQASASSIDTKIIEQGRDNFLELVNQCVSKPEEYVKSAQDVTAVSEAGKVAQQIINGRPQLQTKYETFNDNFSHFQRNVEKLKEQLTEPEISQNVSPHSGFTPV